MKCRFQPLLLSIAFACGSWFYLTNPRTKAPYIDRILHESPKRFCQQPEETLCESLCEGILSVTQPIVREGLTLYTAQPKNFGFFTLYATRLPGLEIYGVGISGQILLWSPSKIPPSVCQAFDW